MPSGKGAGARLKLRPWQRAIVAGIYGDTDTAGLRMCRQAVLSIARKNGKTLFVAGLALVHVVGPEAEANGEVYSAAADREQAAVVFKYAAQIIEATPELRSLKTAGQLNVIETQKRIVFYPLGTFYRALSKEAGTKHGLNPSVVICDELAQWKSRTLYDVLTSAMGARVEPLTIVMSTQAPDDRHILSELIDYGLQVQAGEVDDPHFRLWLYAAPRDASPWIRKTWKLANPALGDFLQLADMADQARKARAMPSAEALFRNLRLNQRIDAAVQFLLPADWDANADAPADPQPGDLVWCGLDLGATQDLTAFVRVIERPGRRLDVLPTFWLPDDGLRERSEQEKTPYDVWHDAGFLETTPGRTVNRDFVARRLYELTAGLDVQGIAFDRWRIEELKQRLADHGDPLPLVDYGQGFKDMAPAVDQLESAVLERVLNHGAHPVLRMCAANALCVSDPAGNRKLDKNKSRGRIDGLAALAMALGLRARMIDAAPPSYLEKGEGLLVL